MRQVFISYSRKDYELVKEFYDRLCGLGYDVWIDKDGIRSGDAFKKEIAQAIKCSCCMVFFSSENANASDWTTKEVSYAVNKKVPIIPVKLDRAEYREEVEFDLIPLDYVDYSIPANREEQMKRFLQSIQIRYPLTDNKKESFPVTPTLTVKNNPESPKRNEPQVKILDTVITPGLSGNKPAKYFGTGNGFEWVDLGLSVKWATCNVGARKPEVFGDYYAWGEVDVKNDYSWKQYKFRLRGDIVDEIVFSEYFTGTSNNPVININRHRLKLCDDVANIKLGGKWRIPTDRDWSQLIDKCIWTRASVNGVEGFEILSKINRKSIFLPAAGRRIDNYLEGDGTNGFYWSSDLDTNLQYNAKHIWFDNYDVHSSSSRRCSGQSIRPVFDDLMP